MMGVFSSSWQGKLSGQSAAERLPSTAPMHAGLQTGPKLNAGVISSGRLSALYSQKLPTQRWDQGSKQLRRLEGSTQPSKMSASITTFKGVLNTSSGQRVGIFNYQLQILTHSISAGSPHNSSANSSIPAHELCFGHCVSNTPLLLRNLHNCWSLLLSQGVFFVFTSSMVIPNALSLKQKCCSRNASVPITRIKIVTLQLWKQLLKIPAQFLN